MGTNLPLVAPGLTGGPRAEGDGSVCGSSGARADQHEKTAPFRGRLDRVSQARREMIPRISVAEESGGENVG